MNTTRTISSILLLIASLFAGPAMGDEISPALDDLSPGWNTIKPGGETRCANGEPYQFSVKKGDPQKLMVFFNGGGACSSGDVCDVNTEPTTYRHLADMPHNDPNTRDGAFALDNAQNPFRDWAQVFVSYCTGDVHLGAKDHTYEKSDGSTILIHHRGKANAQTALDWIFANIDTPERIFVSGGSAGAIAAPYYASILAGIYKESEIVHFSGGAGGFGGDPAAGLPPSWGVATDVPAPFTDDVAGTTDFLDFYRIAAKHHPRIRFHQYNTAYDAVQEKFLQFGGITTPLHPILMKNLDTLKADLPYFRSFTTKGDFHTLLRFDELYTRSVGDQAVLDWVTDISKGNEVEDVSCGDADQCTEEKTE